MTGYPPPLGPIHIVDQEPDPVSIRQSSMLAATLMAVASVGAPAATTEPFDPFGRGPLETHDGWAQRPGRGRRARPGGKQVTPAQKKAKRKAAGKSRAKNRKR